MRLLDLILAMLVLGAILFIARHQFPSYGGMTFAPQAASPSPGPTS